LAAPLILALNSLSPGGHADSFMIPLGFKVARFCQWPTATCFWVGWCSPVS